jgi:hypothetical protein
VRQPTLQGQHHPLIPHAGAAAHGRARIAQDAPDQCRDSIRRERFGLVLRLLGLETVEDFLVGARVPDRFRRAPA